MSCLVMRPPRPVPLTSDKLTLFSRAILRTKGDERACSSSPASSCSCGGAVGAGTGVGAHDHVGFAEVVAERELEGAVAIVARIF